MGSLKERLDQESGFSEVEFTIPHVFLPPRFREQSKQRNMILFLDLDNVVHVRWEGARQDEHQPLTPGAVRRLLKECARNMKKYRRDLDVFGRFIDRTAEAPFWDPREDSLTRDRQDKPAEQEEPEDDSVEEIIAVLGPDGELIQGKVSDFLEEEMGGESPMPIQW